MYKVYETIPCNGGYDYDPIAMCETKQTAEIILDILNTNKIGNECYGISDLCYNLDIRRDSVSIQNI